MTAFATHARLDVIRYSQVWEDHRLLDRGLAIGSGDDVLSVAGAGDNVLALLLAEPRSIVAIDVSPAQLALLELKLAALRRLTHGEFACLTGARGGARRGDLYERVRAGLQPGTRRFWDRRGATIEHGLLRAGMLEGYLERFRLRHIPRAAERLLGLDDRERQAALYDRLLGTPEFEAAFRAAFTPEAMAGRARDATQFRYVDVEDAPGFFLQRLRHVCTELPTRANHYLEWLLTGRYRSAVPPWLRPENFERLRDLAGRVTLVEAELSEYLKTQPAGAFSAVNLSDVFEYLPEDGAQELSELVGTRLRPGGRIAYWNLLVPRSAGGLPARRDFARALWKQDRVFFYSDFHLNGT
jgi:S-adenosylmethionine-diacylglycerol 3-amino-3-carboxypropyl transferase